MPLRKGSALTKQMERCHGGKAAGLRKNIGLCFASASWPLLNSVAVILDKYGIKPHIVKTSGRIYLYGENSVLKYLTLFGSSNSWIVNKYKQWKGARVV